MLYKSLNKEVVGSSLPNQAKFNVVGIGCPPCKCKALAHLCVCECRRFLFGLEAKKSQKYLFFIKSKTWLSTNFQGGSPYNFFFKKKPTRLDYILVDYIHSIIFITIISTCKCKAIKVASCSYWLSITIIILILLVISMKSTRPRQTPLRPPSTRPRRRLRPSEHWGPRAMPIMSTAKRRSLKMGVGRHWKVFLTMCFEGKLLSAMDPQAPALLL